MQQLHIGIRGISGILGNRLALELLRQPDLKVDWGIARNDSSLERLILSPAPLAFPLFIDHERETQYEDLPPVDVVVDTTGKGYAWARSRTVPVLLQSGDYPHGTFISPPYFKEDGQLHRMGDCVSIGALTVLKPIEHLINAAQIIAITQYAKHLHDYPMHQRIHAMYFNDEQKKRITKNLGQALENVSCTQVIEIPGHDYYTMLVTIAFRDSMRLDDLFCLYREQPRVMVAARGITSTYHIDHFLRESLESRGYQIPPVIVYHDDEAHASKREHTLRAAIHSTDIAVLANIDAARIIGARQDPTAAMRLTDHYAKLATRHLESEIHPIA